MQSSPPVLLTVGQYYGTLAAARCLGRAGVRVTLAEGHLLAPARWSRYVERRVRCPEVGDTEAFLSWLLDFGEASPGHALLATSDDVAFLFAENREALARRYHLSPTPLSAIDALLDKQSLHDHCQAVGLDAPETWFPRSEEEAAAIGREVGLPLILKPRTQVLSERHGKGTLVEDKEALVPGFRAFVEGERFGERVRRLHPEVRLPMLQRYYSSAWNNIYGLSGYAGAGGKIIAVRAARKILQRPRKLGIGLCFEEAPVRARLVDGLGALCRRVGYQGVFEVEFVDVGPRAILIDFNPRFYSQMAFDIDRGLPLPRFAYAEALGDDAGLLSLAEEASAVRTPGERVYCHHFLLRLMRRARRLTGRMSAEEARALDRFLSEHPGGASDAVADAGDRAPGAVDVIDHLTSFVRHPRSFVRSMIFDQ